MWYVGLSQGAVHLVLHLLYASLMSPIDLFQVDAWLKQHEDYLASTVSKAPAKPTEGAKAAKKTSSKPAAEASDEKKKRRKVRKETYSSYIYKGESTLVSISDL